MIPLAGRLWISTVCRLVLAGVLGWAGLVKLGSMEESARAVQAYELFSPRVAELIGYGLPVLEVAIAALLLLGLGTRIAAAISAGLMVAFIIGVASVWARGLSIDCGCFGGGGAIDDAQTRYLQEILRDIGLLLVATWLIVFPASRWSLDRYPNPVEPEEVPVG